MNDTYCELIVKRKISNSGLLCRFIAVFATVVAISFGVVFLGAYGLIAAFFFIYLDTIVFRNTDTEYEYQFLSGDLDIDCIYGKMKRKRANKFDLKQIEVLAPLGSEKLSYYDNNKSVKIFDYSSGYEDRKRYAFIIPNGGGVTAKVIFEPNDVMLEAIKMYVPSKVYVI